MNVLSGMTVTTYNNNLILLQTSSKAMTTRRSLRNSNICPTVTNPFRSIENQPPAHKLLPPHLVALLSNCSTLSCQQITSLPSLQRPSNAQTALLDMRSSSQQQFQALGEARMVEQQKQHKQQLVLCSEAPAQEQVKQQVLVLQSMLEMGPLMSDVFDCDLSNFLRQPPNQIIDCEYPFNPQTIVHFGIINDSGFLNDDDLSFN